MSEPAAPQDQPTSIPGPPPHPYAQQTARSGSTFATVAMALGLVALLTTVLSGFYAPVFLTLGVVLGVAAIGLGITALVKRQQRAASIVGLASGALSLVVAVVFGLVAVFGFFTTQIAEAGAGADPGPEAGTDSSQTEDAPFAMSEWPLSLATGAYVFTGDAGKMSLVQADVSGTSERPVASEHTGNYVRVYVDYMCPFCGQFEQENGALLQEAAESGDTVVEIVPLSFLDRLSQGSRYSSRAAGAMTCIAEQQPDVAWQAHGTLLSAEFQPEEGTPGHDDKALIEGLGQAVGGLNEDVRGCITEQKYAGFAGGLTNWVFTNPVPNAKDPSLQVESTPFIVVNGVQFQSNSNSSDELRSFLVEQGIDLK